MAEYIKRDIDLVIQNWFDGTDKSLMILGARQVGKTHSIRHFIRKTYNLKDDEQIPELNLAEMDRARNLLVNESGFSGMPFIQYLFTELQINVDLEKIKVVFIDEIQALSNEKKVKSSGLIKSILLKLIKIEGVRFIFSGSLLGSKISDIDNLTRDLDGGIIQAKMYPLSFPEFVESIDGNRNYINKAVDAFRLNRHMDPDVHIHLLKKFAEYSFVGGMPKSVSAYIDKEKYLVSDSLAAISSLTNDYNEDISKYFREEYNVEIGQDIFNFLLFGLKQNDKKLLMNKLKTEPETIFYNYVIDSDVGLLVEHIKELHFPLADQQRPKTYFNDIGFLRCLIKEHIDSVEDKKNPPKEIKSFFDIRDIDSQKDGFLRWIDGDWSNRPNDNGAYFEQVVAQSLKSLAYKYAYNYIKDNNREQENEFILTRDETAIEVKSGGFGDFTSSKQYAESGKRVLFVTLLPYIGEYAERFYLLPVYLLCSINEEEILRHNFVPLNDDIKSIINDGVLPRNPGFYR